MKPREKAVSLLSYYWSLNSDYRSINLGLRPEKAKSEALLDANKALNNAPNISAYCYWKQVIYILQNC